MTPRSPLERPASRTATRRRPAHRPPTKRRKGLGWAVRLPILAVFIGLLLVGWAIVARKLAPVSNTSLSRFDAIIVLGTTANKDGNPTIAMLDKITEAVHEYDRGVAPRLILTGGKTQYGFVEARVMARAAEAEGIPESAIVLEDEATDTIQNACYSTRIMKAHGWKSAEVITSDFHLPRSGMIFSHGPLEWRMHIAPAISPLSPDYIRFANSVEVLKTMRYLVWARWAEPCNP